MKNFVFHNPTKLIFGENTIKKSVQRAPMGKLKKLNEKEIREIYKIAL